MLVFRSGGCGCGGPLLPPALLTLPAMANVLPVTWQNVAAHLCILLIAGQLDLALPPSPYPSICLGAIHFAVIEFLWSYFHTASITAPLDLDSVST